MNKFKVGDYVEAKIDGWYAITIPGVLCEVVEINVNGDHDQIRVKIIKSGHGYYGHTFKVDADQFKLVTAYFFNKKEIGRIINFLREDL